MEKDTAKSLIELNNRFYRKVARSFSETRQRPWPGWETIADCLKNDLPGKCLKCPKLVACSHAPSDATCVSVLDLACGNLRFESYLEEQLPELRFVFHAVDNCRDFPATPVKSPVRFQQADILEHLLDGDLANALDADPCQAAVSFGFMHHIPSQELRERFLRQMVETLAPGGLACVSLWRFMDDPKAARKTLEVHERAIRETGLAGLEPGDYLVGWQDVEGAYRYCHSFNENEIDDLTECVEPDARLIRRFHADGRNGKSNAYLVFQRN